MSPAASRLLARLSAYRRAFVVGLSAVVLSTGVTLAGPWVLKLAVDDLATAVTRGKLLFYASAILGVALLGGAFRFAMRRVIVGASRRFEYDLRNDIFAHLQRLPPAYFAAHRTGDLMSRATNDLNAVRMMAGPAVMYSVSTALTFIAAVALMAGMNGRLTLVALLPLPIVSLSVRYFGRAIHTRFEAIQAQLSELSAVVQETLAGVRVVRAYGREAHEIGRFEAANREYVERSKVLIRLQGLYYPSLSLLMGLSALLVLWLGSRDVVAGRMSLGDLVAFNAYLMMLSWPMIAFGWVTNMLQRGLASWSRILAILDAEPAIDDRHVTGPGVVPADLAGAVEIRDLTFDYGLGPVLQGISCTVAAGETVAIVGATGAGKSTLLALLARLYDPPPGTIRIDGIDVRELPLATLRGALGVVPQEAFLFSDTLANNVRFGRPDAGDEAVRAAAAVARLDVDVADFPKGYETMVGERGITLSGGQKQRTAIARAVLTDPRILVLDDALSAVDTETEDAILAGLREVRRGRTTFIVSHRISTIRDADQILVLEGGRIVERGRHEALVAAGRTYAAMDDRQRLERELLDIS
ncbi:MAG: ABC transporter ATP-binding protein [Vicinamibacterales bacterium]